jgi:hypothetical protein
MLSNALIAGALASVYVLLLVVQLNPTQSLDLVRLWPLARTAGTFYLLHLTALFYVTLVVRQVLARELFSPAWVSVSVLTWLSSAAAAMGSALMWANAQTFRLVLEPATVTAMRSGAIALGAAATLFALLGLARRYSGRRVALAVALGVVGSASIAIPLALRGTTVPPLGSHPLGVIVDPRPAPPERTVRVTVFALDGGSLRLVTNAAAEGRLPNFGRLLDAGAVMHLATLHPASAETVWTAAATGKLPQKNGVRSAAVQEVGRAADAISLLPAYCFSSRMLRLGFVSEEPHTALSLRTSALWRILSQEGLSVGVVNWPLTFPAPVVRGYVVTDWFSRESSGAGRLAPSDAFYPSELQYQASSLFEEPEGARPTSVAATAEGDVPARRLAAGKVDRFYDRFAQALEHSQPAQATFLRFQSLDTVGHYLLRYAMPSEFGDRADENQARLGAVLEAHYGVVDAAIGRALASLGPDDLLLVASGFGMEPLGVAQRALERLIGDPDLSGTHEAAPDGFLMAYGASVQPARFLARPSVVDLAPTILYFLGLPVGRDMDGYVQTALFRSSFTAERPITFIPTYDR